jgi:hypothetical protein
LQPSVSGVERGSRTHLTGKILDFPPFAGWIKPVARRGTHAFVRDAEQMILYYAAAIRSVPETYGWRFSNVTAIQTQTKNAKTAADLNRVYWTDQTRNAEAYGLLTSWRGAELLKRPFRV